MPPFDQQIRNVATLPGITKYALCMPDGHFGYGFPIGGVAAMDMHEGGVISPGGIGFDINCGMRLVATNLTLEDVQPHLKQLVDKLFDRVPAGVGSTGFFKISQKEFRQLVEEGARWCVDHGYGWQEDLELTEEVGCIAGADASKISERAVERGFNQIGTLGPGTTISRSRSRAARTSSTRSSPRSSGSPSRTRWWSCFTAAAAASAIRSRPTICRSF